VDCGAGVAESNWRLLDLCGEWKCELLGYIIGPTLNLTSSGFTYCHLREIQHYDCFQVAFG